MKDTMKEFIEDDVTVKNENANLEPEKSIQEENQSNNIDVSKLSTDELLRLYKEKYPDEYQAFLDKIYKQFEN